MLPGAEAVFRAGSRPCAGVGHADSCDTPCACTELSSLWDEKTTLSSGASAPNVVLGKEEEAEQSQMCLLGPQSQDWNWHHRIIMLLFSPQFQVFLLPFLF